MGLISVLTDDRSLITKEILDLKLSKTANGHITKGHGQTHDIELGKLPALIRSLNQHQCLCIGIVPQFVLDEYDIDSKNPDKVSRTNEWFSWYSGDSFMLFDFDGFSGTMEEAVGLLEKLDPALAECGLVGVYSSSSLLYNSKTGEELAGKKNFHIYIEVSGGAKIREYGDMLFKLSVLSGYGSIKVIKNSGAKKLKTVFDTSVWSAPNREIFEADVICCADLESKRLDSIEFSEGGVLDIGESIDNLRLTKEDEVSVGVTVGNLRDDPDVIKESELQRKAGALSRATIRARHTNRKAKVELRRAVSQDEWIDKAGVLHTHLGANDYIMDQDANEIKVKDMLLEPDSWNGKSLPDPLNPWKRGDEARGIPGQGIAYVRVNDDESMHIYSFYGDVEYHLVWDMDSIVEELHELDSSDEFDAFVEYVFDTDAVNNLLTKTEIDSISRVMSEKVKAKGWISRLGQDARQVRSELRTRREEQSTMFTANKVEVADEAHITKLNSKFGAVLVGGRARVVKETFDKSLHEWQVEFIPSRDLKEIMKHKRILKQVGGTVKSVCVFDDWELNPNRNTFDNVTFEPRNDIFRGCGKIPVLKQGGDYNLWMGYLANLDNATSCEKILWHIKNIWCGGDEVMNDYVVTWLAELFQKPWKIGQPFLVLKSLEGAGKNIVIDKVICRLLGTHALSTSVKDDLVGRFNSHLGHNVFVFLDEAIFAGDPRTKNLLKSLINQMRTTEMKGIDRVKSRNYTKIILASNEDFVANIDLGDRRYVYPAVSNIKKGNLPYFKELAVEIDNGGREAFLKYMLGFDIKIDTSILPSCQSTQRSADILRSAPAAVRFIIDLYMNGPQQYDEIDGRSYSEIEFKDWENKPALIESHEFMNLFRKYCDMNRVPREYVDHHQVKRKLSSVDNLLAPYSVSKEDRRRFLIYNSGRDRHYTFRQPRHFTKWAKDRGLVFEDSTWVPEPTDEDAVAQDNTLTAYRKDV